MNSISTLQDALKNDRQLFLETLSSFALIDIGTIVSAKNGRAVVHGSSFIGGQQTIYQDAELIFPGNSSGAYSCECAGTTCLIFIPCSCMPSTDNQKVRLTAAPYDKAGVKALPIGNGADNPVKTSFNLTGTYNIFTDLYRAVFEKDNVELSREDAATSLTMDCEGGLHVIKQGDNSTYYKDMIDGSITSTWISKDKDVQWVDTLNEDGSRSFVQADPQDENAEPLFSLTIDKEGVASVTLAKGLTLESADVLTLKGKSVAIESTDGDVSLTANKDQDGDGKVTITSTDDTTITVGSGKKFSANGTNLEVEG